MATMPPIGVIVPTVEIVERVIAVAHDLDMADMVLAKVAYLKDGLQPSLTLAKEMVDEGVEVLVSRRSPAVMISETLNVPNVAIPLTLEDFSLAVSSAREITKKALPRVGVFVMPGGQQKEVEAFSRYLGQDFHLYTVYPDDTYLFRMVDRAIAEKMDVLIAGMLVAVYANEHNLPTVLIDSGPVALRNALEEARRIVHGRRLEQTRAEHLRIVVETSSQGIVMLDPALRVVVANPAAQKILDKTPIEIGTHLTQILPELDLSPCCNDGEDLKNFFLTTAQGPLVLHATPAFINNSLKSVVINFQRAESVNELVVSARNTLHSQGFKSRYTFASILGESERIREAKKKAMLYAAASGSVLLVGETGTGKELFAHAIHHISPYGQGPFIPINCAAIPPSLQESELFGHEEGAFTGASRKGKPGFFELGHQGTVFLDEISELDEQAQLRLLRVLQERNVIRLGGRKLIPIDIRVIAATNKNLYELVEQGRFRRDLFYRLGVLPIFIPALRDREGDIPLLAKSFLRTAAPEGRKLTFEKSQLALLESHDWPGNVRELLSVVERFAIAASTNTPFAMTSILTPDLEWHALRGADKNISLTLSAKQKAERDAIVDALQRHHGRRNEAARSLGMDRTTLFRKMGSYGLR